MTINRRVIPRRIAYLGRSLPTLSETFVVREIAALRQLGAEVKALSIHPPDPFAVHPEAPDLARETEVLARPRHPLFWVAHLLFALFYPGRYWGCLWRQVITAKEPWRRRWRCLLPFAVAPYAAWTCKRLGVAHIHAHFANIPTSVAMMAAHMAGITFSFMAHAYDVFVDNLLLPAKLAAAHFVATCSYFNINYLRERYPEAETAHLEVVRYGIDPARFSPRPQPAARPPLILAVGRLVETKGFHTLVAACGRLREMDIPARCVIIGEGPEADHLTKMIQALGLEEHVTLVGKRQPAEVAAYYQQAELLSMPSCVRNHDRDGIPNVLLEAMAMEIPVVSTRVSGIPELVRDGDTGLLVEPDAPEDLAGALGRLLQDPALARRLARAGRELVVREFNIYGSAAKLLKLFNQSPDKD